MCSLYTFTVIGVKVYSISHALSGENRPPDHPFGGSEGSGARRYPRLVVTESRGLPPPRAQCNLPLLFRSLSTRSCAGKRSCPATGTGAKERSRRVRTGYHNPRDVSCLHKICKGPPTPLRGDDESARAGARCDLPPKPLDVHRRAGATNCRVGPSSGGVCRALGVPPWSCGVRSRSSVRREQTCKRP